ncbi:MAG: energy-coupling factor transporter transmembrane component T family protein [Eggerthellaceae bacterium]|jgi:energy-coupling factor transport system permease protein
MDAMLPTLTTYLPRDSAVHRADARVKIVLLFAYSIALFFIDTWTGMALFAAAFVCAFAASRLPAGRLLATLVPLYVILLFTWTFNAFAFDPQQAANAYGYSAGSAAAGAFAEADPIYLAGTFAFLPGGCVTGCFVVVRILLLTLASFVVAYSTPSTLLVGAVSCFLSPLRRVRVPVDDIAMVFSVALRFIPLLAQEAESIRLAQQARGAHFEDGSFWGKLKAWSAVFIPLFVNLFRRAERLGYAFDARCYGAGERRTTLHPLRMGAGDVATLTGGLAFCIVVAAAL